MLIQAAQIKYNGMCVLKHNMYTHAHTQKERKLKMKVEGEEFVGKKKSWVGEGGGYDNGNMIKDICMDEI